MSKCHHISLLGVYPVTPINDLVEETVKIRWGYKLSAAGFIQAEQSVRDEFSQLFLIEIQLDPPDAHLDWTGITQTISDQPRANWQVPYDERPVGGIPGRWAFFFDFLKFDRPLQTPVGNLPIPRPAPRPEYLADFEYDSR